MPRLLRKKGRLNDGHFVVKSQPTATFTSLILKGFVTQAAFRSKLVLGIYCNPLLLLLLSLRQFNVWTFKRSTSGLRHGGHVSIGGSKCARGRAPEACTRLRAASRISYLFASTCAVLAPTTIPPSRTMSYF